MSGSMVLKLNVNLEKGEEKSLLFDLLKAFD